ncbi:MAG: hypothetical protein HOP16_13510 [Acidobacteria bacterium]|nr:hypothetical protein [Acidobacteriota bacterium]
MTARAFGFRLWALGLASVLLSSALGFAQINMPDPSLINGRALPAPELAPGTITVRVVREAIGNNIVGQDVRLTVGGATRTAKTDDEGRAEFSGLSSGADARAEVTVDGETIASDPLTVPATGGLRVILVSGLQAASARAKEQAAADAASPPVKGVVVLGPNSRVALEFQDDTLRVFYILDVLNNARARVDIGGPLIIDLPRGAGGAAVIQGSSPSATVSGDRLTVTGPFAPGVTSVQVGFTLAHDGPDLELQQTWPVALEQLTVAAEKIGALSIASPQFSTVGEIKSGDGTPFLLASGAALPAGSTLTLQLSGLPSHSALPRQVALALALAIIGAGAWLSYKPRPGGPSKAKLASRRDELLADLAAIEKRRRRGESSGRDAQRQPELLAELEGIYGELDEVRPGPRGGGEDVAA